MPTRKYDSTVARMAGNIAAGLGRRLLDLGIAINDDVIARDCVSLARAIVAETIRTEPSAEPPAADAVARDAD